MIIVTLLVIIYISPNILYFKLNDLPGRVLQVTGITTAASFLLIVQDTIAFMYDNVFIQSYVAGHLCCFPHFFAIPNRPVITYV